MEKSALDFWNPEFDMEKSELEVKNQYIVHTSQLIDPLDEVLPYLAIWGIW